MDITALVRTRNEEKNIARFCKAYSWCDRILVADGGSTDNTIQIAKTFSNVEVRDYTVRKEMKNGLWRNPEAEHLTFLVDWAKEYSTDWIVQDDCDCIPNKNLQADARSLLENTKFDHAYILRVYLWQNGQHMPQAAQPWTPGVWETSMWGWRASKTDVTFRNSDMAFEFSPIPEIKDRLNILPPYCDLHYTWADEQVMLDKMKFYNDSGQIPGIQHPLNWCGKPAPREEWMVYE